MLYFFAYMICPFGIECNENNAFFSRVEITESVECEEDLLKLRKWIERAVFNPASDMISIALTCDLIDQHKTNK